MTTERESGVDIVVSVKRYRSVVSFFFDSAVNNYQDLLYIRGLSLLDGVTLSGSVLTVTFYQPFLLEGSQIVRSVIHT